MYSACCSTQTTHKSVKINSYRELNTIATLCFSKHFPNCISQTIVLFEQNKSLWLTVGKQSASENWSFYQKFSLLVANKVSKKKGTSLWRLSQWRFLYLTFLSSQMLLEKKRVYSWLLKSQNFPQGHHDWQGLALILSFNMILLETTGQKKY